MLENLYTRNDAESDYVCPDASTTTWAGKEHSSTYRPSGEDLDSFRSGRWLYSEFSRTDVNSVLTDPNASTGGRQLADYLSKNFDEVEKLTKAGSKDRVDLEDIRMAIDLAAVKSDVDSILGAKEELLSGFSRIDENGDEQLSKREMEKVMSLGTDHELNEGLSALIARRNAFSPASMFSPTVSRQDIATFNDKAGFDTLAKPEHKRRAEAIATTPYQVFGLAAGTALACSPLFRGSSFLVKVLVANAGAGLGAVAGRYEVSTDVDLHYATSARPAAKKLFP
jgi:hypothetical protein